MFHQTNPKVFINTALSKSFISTRLLTFQLSAFFFFLFILICFLFFMLLFISSFASLPRYYIGMTRVTHGRMDAWTHGRMDAWTHLTPRRRVFISTVCIPSTTSLYVFMSVQCLVSVLFDCMLVCCYVCRLRVEH